MAVSDAVLAMVARRMALMSDPMRIRVLLALRDGDGETSVQDLADALDTEHRNASRAVRALHRDRILDRRREGTRVLYSVADYTACLLIDRAAESVKAQALELSDLVCKDD